VQSHVHVKQQQPPQKPLQQQHYQQQHHQQQWLARTRGMIVPNGSLPITAAIMLIGCPKTALSRVHVQHIQQQIRPVKTKTRIVHSG